MPGHCPDSGCESNTGLKDRHLLNNRQSGRRRRGGRGSQGNPNRNSESGSRIDNRARGNAPQLLEKYRNLAREAQLQGDRVLTEYYLQFADHYFRIVAENRARFEEQRRWRDEDSEGGDDAADGGDEGSQMHDAGEGDAPRREDRRPQRQRFDRSEGRRDAEGAEGDERAEAAPVESRIDVAVLPPAFVSSDPMPAPELEDLPLPDEELEAAPRRRGRSRKEASG